MIFEATMHMFKYFQTLLMPIVYLGDQWIIISSILIQKVVFDEDHLKFFHIETGIHLYCTFVYEVND